MGKYQKYFHRVDKISLLFGVVLAVLIYVNESSLQVHAVESGDELPVTEDILEVLTEPQPVEVVEIQPTATVTAVKSLVSTEAIEKSSEVHEPINVGVTLVDKKVDVYADSDENVPNWESGCRSYNITYMSYTAVTNETSNQYKLLNSDECYTCPETGIRMVGDRYCVALGSGYTSTIGQKVDLIMEDGSIVKCILADCKADEHTDASNRYHSVDGSVAEFVVDYEVFESPSQWKHVCDGKIKKVVLVG